MDDVEREAMEVAAKGPMDVQSPEAIRRSCEELLEIIIGEFSCDGENPESVKGPEYRDAVQRARRALDREVPSKAEQWMVDEGAGELYFRYFEIWNPQTPIVIFVRKPGGGPGCDQEDPRLKEWVGQLAKHLESIPLPATWPDKS